MMYHIMKQSYHGSLIGWPNILQPKWHNLVTEGALLCDKDCLLHVLRCHLDLIVTREPVHEVEYLMLCGVVNQNIDMGKRKVILGDCPVQISVVHTHPHLAVLFRHWDYVSNSLGIRGDN